MGGQCWFADNLATDQYRNGDFIAANLDNTTWSTTTQGACAFFNNDLLLDESYGKVYNWYAVSDARGICPTGWHVPSDCEWMYMEESLGMSIADLVTIGTRSGNEGGDLKTTTGWNAPNTGATNASGFSGVPGGYRSSSGFYNFNQTYGYWWTSTASSATVAWMRRLYFQDPHVYRSNYLKRYGLSVRCIKD